jgi:hypothetical protein
LNILARGLKAGLEDLAQSDARVRIGDADSTSDSLANFDSRY